MAEQVRQTGYHGFLVGTSDLILLHGVDVDATATASARRTTANEDAGARARRCHLPLLPTRTFIEGIKHRFDQIDNPPHPNYGTDVYAASNVLIVPVPRITLPDGNDDAICGDVRCDEHLAPLFRLLPDLSERLCEPFRSPPTSRSHAAAGSVCNR